MATKAKIVVYETPLSDSILKEFDNMEEFEMWSSGKDLQADQVSVNGFVLLGWDELYDFI